MIPENIQIIDYQAEYKDAFKNLNITWIEKYFKVEPHDLEQLEHPEEILEKGGYILFAKIDETIAGTCAVINEGENGFELAKMAVSEAFQGRQIGKLLCLAAIEKARETGAKQIFLESNRKLKPALELYKKVGFEEVTQHQSIYERADIKMVKWLSPPSPEGGV